MTNLPKVLVACPTASNKSYCQDEYIENFERLTYPNKELFIVDNSVTKDNFMHLRSRGINCKYINPKSSNINTILAKSHDECRKYAIRNGFDYLFHKESDIMCPPNTIERLLSHNKPVVHGMYHIQFGDESHLMLTNIELPDKEGSDAMTYHLKMTDIEFVDGTLKPIYGAGIGCAMIRLDVLKVIHFRSKKNSTQPPDSWFSYDLLKLGIQNMVDTSLICEHKNLEWVRF